MSTLTDKEQRVVSYIEQRYFEWSEVVSADKICSDLGYKLTTVHAILRNPEVKKYLSNRGLIHPADGDLLSADQILTINMICNTADRRTLREKLKLIDVSWAQYQSWMRQPAFQRFLANRVEQIFDGLDNTAKIKFAEHIEAGNLKAIEDLFEMKGLLNKRGNESLDVVAFLTAVLEILTRHVSAEVLQKVATDLEILAPNILNGRRVVPIETSAEPTPVLKEPENADLHSF